MINLFVRPPDSPKVHVGRIFTIIVKREISNFGLFVIFSDVFLWVYLTLSGTAHGILIIIRTWSLKGVFSETAARIRVYRHPSSTLSLNRFFFSLQFFIIIIILNFHESPYVSFRFSRRDIWG